jgi:hypothetical protein
VIEADFISQYGIDLMEAIDGMTWRKFTMLLNGLGPGSTFIALQQQRNQSGAGHQGRREVTIDGDEDPGAFGSFLQSMVTKKGMDA